MDTDSSAPLEAPRKLRIMDVDISATSYENTCDFIIDSARRKSPGYICICNVHTVVEGRQNPDYAEILNNAKIATPDGMPLVWAMRRLGEPSQQRVYGPDLLLEFAKRVSQHGGPKSYFYGGREGVAEELARTLQEKFPGFEVAGFESPPFRELTDEEEKAAAERINASGAGVVWVGLGAPKQERWMARHQSDITSVMVGVGAAFDFHTGSVKQAPRWMMNHGLEWLFRLAMEPRRLWRRYLIYNPIFVWGVVRQLMKRK